ncbi:MAG: hypothetical protein IPI49_15535 [Myxococcales bacterium]|nr:hypothetical protein [Myxococcales bacterium]
MGTYACETTTAHGALDVISLRFVDPDTHCVLEIAAARMTDNDFVVECPWRRESSSGQPRSQSSRPPPKRPPTKRRVRPPRRRQRRRPDTDRQRGALTARVVWMGHAHRNDSGGIALRRCSWPRHELSGYSAYERAIVCRFGRARQKALGPGLVLMLPFGIDRANVVDTRTKVIQIPPQEVITRDNISIAVDAVVYVEISSPMDAILRVEQYLPATCGRRHHPAVDHRPDGAR